jgi:hypothetical protein
VSIGQLERLEDARIILAIVRCCFKSNLGPVWVKNGHLRQALGINRWMPVSVNKKLGANDRCSPGGAVITACLSAVVEGGTIVGWMKNSAFTVREVQLDGTLVPLDLSAVATYSVF